MVIKKSSRSPKRSKQSYFFVVECPDCDYATWLWRSLRAAYGEFVEHVAEEHNGYVEFVGEGSE